MPSTNFSSFVGIDATSLSARARTLLMEGDEPDVRASAAAPPVHAQVLLWTLLVMRAPRLLRFADHLGMLGAGPVLRHVLEGRRITAFREQLGPELYHFGVLRAPLIGALSFASAAFDDPKRVTSAVREAGVAALRAFCQGPDSEQLHLRARLCARLDEVAPGSPFRFFVAPPSGALLQRVLREVEPVLASAFDGIGATP
jgi:hypothetical protein